MSRERSAARRLAAAASVAAFVTSSRSGSHNTSPWRLGKRQVFAPSTTLATGVRQLPFSSRPPLK